MGKDRTGLSIFWPDDGLDEGPIMLQKTCAIGPDETLGDVYFKKLFPMGVDAMLEGLDLVKSGVIIKHDQRLEDGTYEGWFGKNEAALDWSAPAATVYNTIRATNPAPGAWTTVAGQVLKISDSALVDGTGTPGEVVSVTDEGVTVQADGGRILMKRVRADEGKVPAAEWATKAGITAGMTMGQ
jgi:methionyl-tRNA formyltransferase